MNSENFEEIKAVVHIVKQAGPFSGNKSLQKLIFIGQQLSQLEIWDYHWHQFGPYSSSLQKAFQRAIDYGLLRYKGYPHGIQLNLDSPIIDQFTDSTLPIEIALLISRINQARKILKENQDNPEFLEIVASLLFLKNETGTYEGAMKELIRRKGHRLSLNDLLPYSSYLDVIVYSGQVS